MYSKLALMMPALSDSLTLSCRLQLMNVSGLSRDNVASHLQKHRLGLKRSRFRKRAAAPPGKGKARRKSAAAADAALAPHAAEHCDDQAGTRAAQRRLQQERDEEALDEREGSNPRANDGSCDPGEGNDGSNGRAGDGHHNGSDDGGGVGSDNRHSACVENANAHSQREVPESRRVVAGAHAASLADAAGANAPPPLEAPPAQHTPQRAGSGSGVGSNGEGKGSGTAPPSAGGGSRFGSSRATAGSGNAAAATDVGSRPGAAPAVATLPSAIRQ
jgi:hypothetical protein